MSEFDTSLEIMKYSNFCLKKNKVIEIVLIGQKG